MPVSGNQVKPGPETRGARTEATANSCGKHVRQAEQVLFVGAVAVQQDQERLAGALASSGWDHRTTGAGKASA